MYEPSHHLLSILLQKHESTFKRLNVLVVGTGEYVTGYVHSRQSESDKPIGVVMLSLIDLKRRGFINSIALCGTNGTKFPYIRQHLQNGLSKLYDNISKSDLEFESYPADDVSFDEYAYKNAISKLNNGDIVIVFTPDHTHFDICKTAMEHGAHVLCAKPIVQTLDHHLQLAKIQKEKHVLCTVEVHKRWDPIYQDARERIAQGALGNFSFYQSYMSQPITQLHTFKHWADKSDISYYLNAHHIDFHCWALNGLHQDQWRPISVTACGSYGAANSEPYNIDTEDSITLTVQWQQIETNNFGTAIYTSSWIAPKQNDVHSQQRFFYQGTSGEINIDQAHRGYTIASESTGFKSVNPLFMKYTPDAHKRFAGHIGYGYRSIAAFIESVFSINNNIADLSDVETQLPTVVATPTLLTTAILEAGRKSLNRRRKNESSEVRIVYDDRQIPVNLN
jgi:D-galacturonate reductase